MIKKVFVFLTTVFATMQLNSAMVTYQLPDINTSPTYLTVSTGQTFTGNGFVGMNNMTYGGVPPEEYGPTFAHVFDLEAYDFGKTAMQVDISALKNKSIVNAFLNFRLASGWEGSPQNITVSTFAANGHLGWEWDPVKIESAGYVTYGGGYANSLDITALVQHRLDNNATWLGLHLVGSDNSQWTFTSDNNYWGIIGNPDSAQVRLVVNYENDSTVPEPSTVIAGLILFVPFSIQAMRVGRNRRV